MAPVKHPPEKFIGKRFNRWKILSVLPRHKGNSKVLCRCNCGTVRPVLLYELRNNLSRSCGCLSTELRQLAVTTHGKSRTPEYRIWKDIRRRCNSKKRSDYSRYGGRGIQVCKRWDNFVRFLEDMGPRPSNSHSIERIDNSKGYSPTNCKWATEEEQRNNKRNCRKIIINDQTKTLAQWCRHFKISYRLVHDRITKLGWDPEIALTTPKRDKKT